MHEVFIIITVNASERMSFKFKFILFLDKVHYYASRYHQAYRVQIYTFIKQFMSNDH